MRKQVIIIVIFLINILLNSGCDTTINSKDDLKYHPEMALPLKERVSFYKTQSLIYGKAGRSVEQAGASDAAAIFRQIEAYYDDLSYSKSHHGEDVDSYTFSTMQVADAWTAMPVDTACDIIRDIEDSYRTIADATEKIPYPEATRCALDLAEIYSMLIEMNCTSSSFKFQHPSIPPIEPRNRLHCRIRTAPGIPETD